MFCGSFDGSSGSWCYCCHHDWILLQLEVFFRYTLSGVYAKRLTYRDKFDVSFMRVPFQCFLRQLEPHDWIFHGRSWLHFDVFSRHFDPGFTHKFVALPFTTKLLLPNYSPRRGLRRYSGLEQCRPTRGILLRRRQRGDIFASVTSGNSGAFQQAQAQIKGQAQEERLTWYFFPAQSQTFSAWSTF